MPALPFIALAATVVGTVGSIVQQRKAGKAAERQAAAERRKAEIENVRKTRQSIREARLAQASLLNQAAQSGGVGGSALAGGTSSLGSQLAGNLSYMSDIATENTSIFNAAQAGARAQSNSAVYGAVGKLGGTIFGDMGGLSKLQVGQEPRGDT